MRRIEERIASVRKVKMKEEDREHTKRKRSVSPDLNMYCEGRGEQEDESLEKKSKRTRRMSKEKVQASIIDDRPRSSTWMVLGPKMDTNHPTTNRGVMVGQLV